MISICGQYVIEDTIRSFWGIEKKLRLDYLQFQRPKTVL